MLRLNSRAPCGHFTTQLWWATIRHCIQMYLPFPFNEWYITCPFCVVCGRWGLLLWLFWLLRYILAFESRNNMIKRFCYKMAARLKIYFLFGWSIGCVRGLWQRKGYVEKKVLPGNVLENVLERITRIKKSGSGVEPQVVSIHVSWTNLL